MITPGCTFQCLDDGLVHLFLLRRPASLQLDLRLKLGYLLKLPLPLLQQLVTLQAQLLHLLGLGLQFCFGNRLQALLPFLLFIQFISGFNVLHP